MSEMIAFPSIESLRQVVTGTKMRCEFDKVPLPVVDYVGTVKLHGSNASVRFTPDGEIVAQSRTRVLSVGDDNFGFAAFVEKNKSLFKHFRDIIPENEFTIYGEWCGGNIQPKVALEQLEKHFVIFSILVGESMRPVVLGGDVFVWNDAGIWCVSQIPTYTVTVDFNNPEACVDQLSDLTIAVEKECPWGKFRGVSGIGEGIVWAPVDTKLPFEMWFKTKGLDHKRDPKPAKVAVAAEVMATQRELAEKMLPDWRLEQGISVLRERGLNIEPKNIGVYLQWIGEDVQKEEQDTMAANGTDWKAISPMVLQRARQYILELCKKF